MIWDYILGFVFSPLDFGSCFTSCHFSFLPRVNPLNVPFFENPVQALSENFLPSHLIINKGGRFLEFPWSTKLKNNNQQEQLNF